MSGRAAVNPLEATYGEVIDALGLDERDRQFMRLRWLDQLAYSERVSRHARRWYHALRLITVVGALIVPALIGAQVSESVRSWAAGAAFAISLLVAICAGVEELFHFGERWRHYRQLAEQLKSEGWTFFQLAGPYAEFGRSYADACPTFVGRIEALLQSDVKTYLRDVVREREQKPPGQG